MFLWDIVFPLLEYQQAHSGCCKLLSPALICHPSFLDWDPPPLLPWSCWSLSALPASESGPLVANGQKFPAAEQMTCQTGLPPRHSLRHWWLPLGHRKKRKSRPVLFGSLLGQACWFKEEKKGKGIRKKEKKDNNPLWVLPMHFQIAEVKTECQGFLWMSSCVTRETDPRWESADVPGTLLIQLLNAQWCWPTTAGLCYEFLQPLQASNCIWEHQTQFVLLWVNVFWSLSHCWRVFWCLEPHSLAYMNIFQQC